MYVVTEMLAIEGLILLLDTECFLLETGQNFWMFLIKEFCSKSTKPYERINYSCHLLKILRRVLFDQYITFSRECNEMWFI